jgi:hypothetical protein
MERLSPKSFASIIDSIEFQKAYLFRISLPEVLLVDSSGQTPSAKLKPFENFELCTSATMLPSISSGVKTIPYFNGELKIAEKTTYANWSATFRLDINKSAAAHGTGPVTNLSKGFSFFNSAFGLNLNIPLDSTSTYQYFYNWARVVYNIKSRVSYLPIYYKNKIDLFLLNEQAQDVLNFTLFGAFPISISGGNLDYGNDSILTYNVDFAYDSFELNDVTAASQVSAKPPAQKRADILKQMERKAQSAKSEIIDPNVTNFKGLGGRFGGGGATGYW